VKATIRGVRYDTDKAMMTPTSEQIAAMWENGTSEVVFEPATGKIKPWELRVSYTHWLGYPVKGQVNGSFKTEASARKALAEYESYRAKLVAKAVVG
jgi:hypothetical protein